MKSILLIGVIAAALGGCVSTEQRATEKSPTAIDTYIQKRAEKQAKAESNLNEARAKARALIARARKDDGFPPENDLVGTIKRCDQIIAAKKIQIRACSRKGVAIVGARSQEPADVAADGIMALCQPLADDLTKSVTPWCISDLQTAGQATASYTKAIRSEVLGAIVALRAGGLSPRVAPPPKRKANTGTDI